MRLIMSKGIDCPNSYYEICLHNYQISTNFAYGVLSGSHSTLLPVLADSNVTIPSSPALLYAHSKCESINPDSAIYCAIDFVIVLFSCMVLKTNKSTFV